MKDADRKQLDEIATGCDRAIVRLTMKLPSSLSPADVTYVTQSLAAARDALQWASKKRTAPSSGDL